MKRGSVLREHSEKGYCFKNNTVKRGSVLKEHSERGVLF